MSDHDSGQSLEFGRKNPVQKRAVETVNSVLEAAARVLIRDALEGLSVKKVIEVAGVSVGSFYQYFSGKESLFAALIERQIENDVTAIKAKLKEMEALPPFECVKALVDLLIEQNIRERGLRRILIKQVERAGLGYRVKRAEQEVADHVVALIRAKVGSNPSIDPEVSKYVMRKAVLGAIYEALSEDSPHVDHPDFARSLAQMIMAFIQAGPQTENPDAPGIGKTG